MALGLSRMQPRSARPPITPPAEQNSNPTQEQDWLAQRGAILFEATCDLIGGFPGFADLGGELADATARISERFLIVDENKSHGFGIPVSWLDGAVLVPQSDRDDSELRIIFSDGASTRLFSIRFRPNRLAMRGGKRAERAQDALNAAGLITAAPQGLPEFTLPWELTEEFDHEHVLWTGHASAPVRVGQEQAPSEIWLSTESLIWGSSDGNGLNRVPMDALSDVSAARLKDRAGTPAIYLAVANDQFGRYEIPFVFDQQETPDRNFRERSAFLAALQSRAIPEGVTTPLWQPWRLDVHPARRVAEAEAFETVPVMDLTSAEPAEIPGVRARLESWLPKLHAFANRGLSLPTVEDDKATVVAFSPDASIGESTPDLLGVTEPQASDPVAEPSPELMASDSIDNAQPQLVELFAEATVLASPETTFVLSIPGHPNTEPTKAAAAGDPSASPLDEGRGELAHLHEAEELAAVPETAGPLASPLDEGSEVQIPVLEAEGPTQAAAAEDALDSPLDEERGELMPMLEADVLVKADALDDPAASPSIEGRAELPLTFKAETPTMSAKVADPSNPPQDERVGVQAPVLAGDAPAVQSLQRELQAEDVFTEVNLRAHPEDTVDLATLSAHEAEKPAHLLENQQPSIATLSEGLASGRLSLAQRFETAALGVVADALQMIDVRLETGSLEPLSRVHSLSADRDAAFAEIRALGASKTWKKRDVRSQIERLTNLHDAGIRLRSLVELYDRGRLNNPELEQLRAKLVANVVLSPLVVPLAAPERETAGRQETFLGV